MRFFLKAGMVTVLVFGAVGWATPGQVYQWGSNIGNLPLDNTNFTQVAAGTFHAVALRSNGTLAGWGDNYYGQTSTVPGGNDYIAIAAGGNHSIALKSDGSVVGWGNQTTAQTGPFKAIAAGFDYNLALNEYDGSLVEWGDTRGYPLPTDKDFTALAVGKYVCLGLKEDGSIKVWGDDHKLNLINDAPLTTEKDFVAVAAGYNYCLALRKNGSLLAWGADSNRNITDLPSGNGFVDITAGELHSLARKADGTVVGWGLNGNGQCNPPSDKKFSTIAGGGFFSTGIQIPEPATVGFLTLGALAFLLHRKRA